ncbi:penicillin-binding protein 1A [Ktedonobacteria bacterium brp13]|nr:penicillin-binding protein 1A [Ktedonobacteria bacterium brp13]
MPTHSQNFGEPDQPEGTRSERKADAKPDSSPKRREKALRYLDQKQRRRERASDPNKVADTTDTNDAIDTVDTYNHAAPTASGIATTIGAVGAKNAIDAEVVTHAPKNLRQEFRRRRTIKKYLSRKYMRNQRLQAGRSFKRLSVITISICVATALIFLILTGAGSYVSYRFYSDTTNQFGQRITSLRDLMPRDNLKIYDSHNTLLSQMTDQGYHTEVPLDQITPTLINATVSVEDKNFWRNQGIDILRIIQAALADMTHKQVVQGGSTITQQLIKNLVVGNETNITRKLQEIVLTPDINSHYNKKDIMEMYLNSIFYGNQAYGIDAAATIYFGLTDQPGKDAAAQLDLAQSAVLAGIPSSPSRYNPYEHPVAARNRFMTVLDLMVRDGYISRAQAQDAAVEYNKPDFFKGSPAPPNLAPHFSEYVIRQMEKQFHMTRLQLSRSGMDITTTLDLNLQNQVQKIAQHHIAELVGHNVTNAAEVIIDFHTGAIKTLLGSLDYNDQAIDGKFDVASQGFRQPGSSFKPYVYATALQQGASPSQPIDDIPLNIVMPPGSTPPVYQPKNYDLRYHGHVTIRCALQNSLNVPAVKTLEHVGVAHAMATATKMGITHTEGTPGLSMVLGGLDVNLLEHTSAFGAFADGGVRVPPYAIEKVVTTYNNQVYTHQLVAGQQVLTPQIAFIMTDILSDNNSRLPEFFNCNDLQLYSHSQNDCYMGDRGTVRPAAAKTGTTNDFRDNWTMGYTTDFVMGVWVGNDDNTPMLNVSGIDGAAPIWHESMLAAEQGHPIHDFTNPGGIERMGVIYPDGLQTTDWFLPGTYPDYNHNPPQTNPAAQFAPTAFDAHGRAGHHHHSLETINHQPASTHDALTFGGHPYCSNFSFVSPIMSVNRAIW